MKSLSIYELKVGDSSAIKKIFKEAEVLSFADITTDHNPAHVDKDYASKTRFKRQIVHGMFVGSLFSAIFGVSLPGLGSIYVKQSLKFTRPVYFGDKITAKVTIKEIKLERNRVIFDCLAVNQNGDVVIVGEAEIMPPRKGKL